MVELNVTKSHCNRILSITRNLKDKGFENQVVYLTCHLLALSTDIPKQQIAKKYLRSKPDFKTDCLKKLKKTPEYELVLDFWTNDSLQHFLVYKGAIITAKRKVALADLEYRETTTTSVYFEECFAKLLTNLKLTETDGLQIYFEKESEYFRIPFLNISSVLDWYPFRHYHRVDLNGSSLEFCVEEVFGFVVLWYRGWYVPDEEKFPYLQIQDVRSQNTAFPLFLSEAYDIIPLPCVP